MATTTTREERRAHANVAIRHWPATTCGVTVERMIGYLDAQEEDEQVVKLHFFERDRGYYYISAVGGGVYIHLQYGRPWGINDIHCCRCGKNLWWCSAATPRRDTRHTRFFDIQENKWVNGEVPYPPCDWRTAAELLMGKHLKLLRECKDDEITFRCPCRDETLMDKFSRV